MGASGEGGGMRAGAGAGGSSDLASIITSVSTDTHWTRTIYVQISTCVSRGNWRQWCKTLLTLNFRIVM